ncbi:galactose oxidase [Parapedobacter deserti]|uniref:Galactose oxidase n=1 Tax=Parapedobacter deserti TaxID=1912957 RepID=A0ABV7JFW1_9SPHI
MTRMVTHTGHQAGDLGLTWRQLPQVPDAVGFAGVFAGVSNGHLLVAGGSHFSEGTRPWSGGTKIWSDKIYALKGGAEKWEEVGKLPRAIGYGVSLTWNDQVLLIGGSDQQCHRREAYALRFEKGRVMIDTLPDLPYANANACGALIGDVIYLAGGLERPTACTAGHTFWTLDLAKPVAERQWKVLEPWPGKPRMLSVAGSFDGAFYLMSGVALEGDNDSAPQRKYLTDAFKYWPGKGWEQIDDLPYATAAAPSPAFTNSGHRLLVFGGDDGSLAEKSGELKDEHPGFRTGILVFDMKTGAWRNGGEVWVDRQPDSERNPNASTWAPVTTPLVVWEDEVILPMGETRPGVRTNRVLAAKPTMKR